MLYLTPAQFRALNLGVKTDGWIDAELAPILARASADANAYCTVPTGHSFLGGVVTGETHVWSVDPYRTTPQRRVWPYHRPVVSIESMRIYATASQYLNFTTAELYYERSEGWVEPASANLTSYGLFGSSVLPFVGLSEPYAKLDYTYGFRYPETVRLWYQGNGGLTWRATSGFWAADAIEVRVNGTVASPADYVISRTEGTVRWTANNPTGEDEVVADVVATIHPDISLATGLIAAHRVSERSIVAGGFPMGLRSMKVAEVALERDLPRSRLLAVEPSSIPETAQELLSSFVYYPLAFG